MVYFALQEIRKKAFQWYVTSYMLHVFIYVNSQSKIEKVPRGIRGEKSSNDIKNKGLKIAFLTVMLLHFIVLQIRICDC